MLSTPCIDPLLHFYASATFTPPASYDRQHRIKYQLGRIGYRSRSARARYCTRLPEKGWEKSGLPYDNRHCGHKHRFACGENPYQNRTMAYPVVISSLFVYLHLSAPFVCLTDWFFLPIIYTH